MKRNNDELSVPNQVLLNGYSASAKRGPRLQAREVFLTPLQRCIARGLSAVHRRGDLETKKVRKP